MVLLPSSESPKTSKGGKNPIYQGAFVCWEFQGNGYKPLWMVAIFFPAFWHPKHRGSRSQLYDFIHVTGCVPFKLPWPSDETSVTSWWLNQPLRKICSSNWIISPNRDEHNLWNHHLGDQTSSVDLCRSRLKNPWKNKRSRNFTIPNI